MAINDNKNRRVYEPNLPQERLDRILNDNEFGKIEKVSNQNIEALVKELEDLLEQNLPDADLSKDEKDLLNETFVALGKTISEMVSKGADDVFSPQNALKDPLFHYSDSTSYAVPYVARVGTLGTSTKSQDYITNADGAETLESEQVVRAPEETLNDSVVSGGDWWEGFMGWRLYKRLQLNCEAGDILYIFNGKRVNTIEELGNKPAPITWTIVSENENIESKYSRVGIDVEWESKLSSLLGTTENPGNWRNMVAFQEQSPPNSGDFRTVFYEYTPQIVIQTKKFKDDELVQKTNIPIIESENLWNDIVEAVEGKTSEEKDDDGNIVSYSARSPYSVTITWEWNIKKVSEGVYNTDSTEYPGNGWGDLVPLQDNVRQVGTYIDINSTWNDSLNSLALPGGQWYSAISTEIPYLKVTQYDWITNTYIQEWNIYIRTAEEINTFWQSLQDTIGAAVNPDEPSNPYSAYTEKRIEFEWEWNIDPIPFDYRVYEGESCSSSDGIFNICTPQWGVNSDRMLASLGLVGVQLPQKQVLDNGEYIVSYTKMSEGLGFTTTETNMEGILQDKWVRVENLSGIICCDVKPPEDPYLKGDPNQKVVYARDAESFEQAAAWLYTGVWVIPEDGGPWATASQNILNDDRFRQLTLQKAEPGTWRAETIEHGFTKLEKARQIWENAILNNYDFGTFSDRIESLIQDSSPIPKDTNIFTPEINDPTTICDSIDDDLGVMEATVQLPSLKAHTIVVKSQMSKLSSDMKPTLSITDKLTALMGQAGMAGKSSGSIGAIAAGSTLTAATIALSAASVSACSDKVNKGIQGRLCRTEQATGETPKSASKGNPPAQQSGSGVEESIGKEYDESKPHGWKALSSSAQEADIKLTIDSMGSFPKDSTFIIASKIIGNEKTARAWLKSIFSQYSKNSAISSSGREWGITGDTFSFDLLEWPPLTQNVNKTPTGGHDKKEAVTESSSGVKKKLKNLRSALGDTRKTLSNRVSHMRSKLRELTSSIQLSPNKKLCGRMGEEYNNKLRT